jgi:hypothetical protein
MPIRRGDGMRLAVATAILLTMLVATFFTTGYFLKTYAETSAARAALAAQTQKIAELQARLDLEARRIGSIVLTSDRGGCEELRFDNFTGAFISIANVDCDTRLMPPVTVTKRQSGTGMRGMLNSFKK